MSTPILPPENAIVIIRGTSKTLQVTVYNPDGTAANITGAKLVLSVKTSLYDDLPTVQKVTTVPSQAVITKPREGLVEFYFEPRDTQGLMPMEYIFDVWLILPTGERYAVVPPSTLTVQPSVTYLPL